MRVFPKDLKWIKNEIRGNLLLRGILVLLPFAYLFWLTENYSWLQISVLSISILIVEEKLKLTVLGILLHWLGIVVLFNLLFLTQFQPFLFVVICTISATAIIWITTQGEQLRTLGNWTFIPAIILSIELAAEMKFGLLEESKIIFPFLVMALLPTLCLGLYEQIRAIQREGHFNMLQLSYLSDFGEKKSNLEAMFAMALGITISACLVEYLPMENGQWMIWGVASVITGNRETSPKKFNQRLIGVSIGVPLGILFGEYVIPSTPFDLTIVTLFLLLTLVAFRRYVVAYTFRCFFVGTVVMLLTHSRTIAFERFSHVVAGGIIGLLSMVLSRFVLKKMRLIS
ncbi:FUSC family protein [Legionella cardiaca]|uniref:FUSC family protein n=1 Tax=Legionella cardiaca TaxID=1071983 RepID=A0ABY8AVI6_9GAMM|nr:FUSC family protein [Legionella cardiaca]WED44588.1 FUSC family protein [Legionella cardiaca]